MEYLKELKEKFLESGLVEKANWFSVQIELTKGQGLEEEIVVSLSGYPAGVFRDFSKQIYASGFSFEEALLEFKVKVEKLCQ